MNDGRGPVGKLSPEDQAKLENKAKKMQLSLDSDPCIEVRREYEGHCAKSWVSLHINRYHYDQC